MRIGSRRAGGGDHERVGGLFFQRQVSSSTVETLFIVRVPFFPPPSICWTNCHCQTKAHCADKNCPKCLNCVVAGSISPSCSVLRKAWSPKTNVKWLESSKSIRKFKVNFQSLVTQKIQCKSWPSKLLPSICSLPWCRHICKHTSAPSAAQECICADIYQYQSTFQDSRIRQWQWQWTLSSRRRKQELLLPLICKLWCLRQHTSAAVERVTGPGKVEG